MGICISSASAKNHESKVIPQFFDFGEENLYSCRIPGLASLYSQEGKKGPNQDSAVINQGYGLENGVFCGVFDGHGRNGRIVSRIVRDRLPSLILSQHKTLSSLYSNTGEGLDRDDTERVCNNDFVSTSKLDHWRVACTSAFKALDKELKLLEKLDCSGSGTTAVTIIKQGKDVIIANLGDSRAVLGTRSDEGNLMAVQLTTDLKPSVPQEAERIKNCRGRVFALEEETNIQRVWLPEDDTPGLAMTRAFGDFMLKSYGIIAIPQMSHYHLSDKDEFLVLATDGVWDVLSNEQVVSIVSSAENEEAAAQALVEEAVCAWKHKFQCTKTDDSTAICLFL
ncbi:probable protein phosphatase 2C 12 [Aristolochia californica]|uniref:probable protein phosphatase 2C 12 n=1 Tax=Aristolochia californica TaxID=171875 RepID=UPI0035D6508F